MGLQVGFNVQGSGFQESKYLRHPHLLIGTLVDTSEKGPPTLIPCAPNRHDPARGSIYLQLHGCFLPANLQQSSSGGSWEEAP